MAHLHGIRAGLEVLTGDTAHLDHGQGCGVGQHNRHLQDRLEPSPNRIRRVGREGFGTVATGQDEGFAAARLAEVIGENVAFPGENKRRLRSQLREHLLQGGSIRPGRLLNSR